MKCDNCYRPVYTTITSSPVHILCDACMNPQPITKSAWDDLEDHEICYMGEVSEKESYSNILAKIEKYESELKRMPAKEDK